MITQDKNHIPWNKNHIPPLRKPRGFSRQSYRSLTGKRQRHSECITCRRPLQWPQPKSFSVVGVVFKCLRQRSNGLNYIASSILHVCVFLVSFGIIKHLWHAGSGTMKFYSPTSMLFPSGVALREYDIIGRIHFHISLTSMQYMYIIHLALCRHLNIKLVDKLS